MIKLQLLFENGQAFFGTGFGACQEIIALVSVHTAMAGYQEIFSDPAVCGQMLLMTYPLIGGYGMADEDYESRIPRLSALIIREYNDLPSNFRFTRTLGDVMLEHGIPGIQGVDTRKIARMLQREGPLRAILTAADTLREEGLRRMAAAPHPADPVRQVSCKRLWYARTPNHRCQVVAVDLGIKQSLLRRLSALHANVTVVPYDTPVEDVLSLRGDGVIFTGGPGDPAHVPEVEGLIRGLSGKLPLLGIGLGHQLIARAHGAETQAMKNPHRGCNHPVRELHTGKIIITAQNQGYEVLRSSLQNTPFTLTHEDVLDGCVMGLRWDELSILTAQYLPEGGPGPADEDLFAAFFAMMDAKKGGMQHA